MIKETKSKKQTDKEKIEGLQQQIKTLNGNLNRFDMRVENLRKNIQKVDLKLKFVIDKQTSEIRVLGEDGKWGGYTGVFYVDPKDRKKIISDKALNHYKRYFENNTFYKNRTLGLFIRTPKGRKLIKVLQDNNNRVN